MTRLVPKEKKLISRDESINLIMNNITDDKISIEDLQKHFLFSLENIIDESCRKSNKYWYLEFHEYQEFLSRVALQLFPNEKAIEYKVYKLLELLYQHEGIKDKTSNEALSPDLDITLIPINEDEEC